MQCCQLTFLTGVPVPLPCAPQSKSSGRVAPRQLGRPMLISRTTSCPTTPLALPLVAAAAAGAGAAVGPPGSEVEGASQDRMGASTMISASSLPWRSRPWRLMLADPSCGAARTQAATESGGSSG
jgi:hypothetical protein